ncbi:hypothetical protein [Labrys sp. KNU-23]|nr:hypothetical protein [Labrys sp. KNU-23]
MALRHEITYRKPAFFDEDVIAIVILEKARGAKALYDIITKHKA